MLTEIFWEKSGVIAKLKALFPDLSKNQGLEIIKILNITPLEVKS